MSLAMMAVVGSRRKPRSVFVVQVACLSRAVTARLFFTFSHYCNRFPIHCAVMGGSLELVKWMVEAHDVPLSVRRDPKSGLLLSVQTSKSRTLVDLAMTGRPKIPILGYLVSKNLSVLDCKDPTLAPKTLQTLMSAGYRFERKDGSAELDVSDLQSLLSRSSQDTLEDGCIICCEKHMDCVLTPCGHQVCCSDCGIRLAHCPVCKQKSTVLKVRKC